MEDNYSLLAIVCLRLLLAWFFACIGTGLGATLLNRDDAGWFLAVHPLFPVALTVMGFLPGFFSALVSFLCLVAVSLYVGFVTLPWWSCLLVVTAYAVLVPVVLRAWRS
jgi:hypothetical protein